MWRSKRLECLGQFLDRHLDPSLLGRPSQTHGRHLRIVDSLAEPTLLVRTHTPSLPPSAPGHPQSARTGDRFVLGRRARPHRPGPSSPATDVSLLPDWNTDPIPSQRTDVSKPQASQGIPRGTQGSYTDSSRLRQAREAARIPSRGTCPPTPGQLRPQRRCPRSNVCCAQSTTFSDVPAQAIAGFLTAVVTQPSRWRDCA